MALENDLETAIVKFFLRSHDFNGLPMSALSNDVDDEEKIKAAIRGLIEKGRISCAFASISVNPHVKRFPDLPIDDQIAQFERDAPKGVCFYPSADLVREHFDVKILDDRPFTKKLLLGAAQLDWEGFDLGVLDRYYNDPRYHFHFDDFGGRLSIRSDADEDSGVPSHEKVFIQTFGLGYDEAERRVAVVFLRYLSGLSPEHQQYWNTFVRPGPIRLHAEYYRSAYLGELFPESGSFFEAILNEMRLINELTSGIYGKTLFRTVPADSRPAGLTPFLRPTLKNFKDFLLAMDKLLSENIDREFFRGEVPLQAETETSDGEIIVENKRTLALLEEWMRKKIQWDDEEAAVNLIVGPLKRIHRLCRAPAEKLEENEFSPEYDDERHAVVKDVYESLVNLRETLAGHPNAPAIKIPSWISEGKVTFA